MNKKKKKNKQVQCDNSVIAFLMLCVNDRVKLDHTCPSTLFFFFGGKKNGAAQDVSDDLSRASSPPLWSSLYNFVVQIRAQVKRLEIGPFVHSAEYNHPFAQTTWPTEEMTFFYVAYGQHLMGVKIREKVRIEWYFEDISKIAVVKATASNGHDVEFVRFRFPVCFPSL